MSAFSRRSPIFRLFLEFSALHQVVLQATRSLIRQIPHHGNVRLTGWLETLVMLAHNYIIRHVCCSCVRILSQIWLGLSFIEHLQLLVGVGSCRTAMVQLPCNKRLQTADQAAWSAVFKDAGTRRGHMRGLVGVHHLQESMLRCRWSNHLLHLWWLRLILILTLDSA